MRSLLAAVGLTAALAACTSMSIEDAAFESVLVDGWAYGDTVTLQPEVEDSLSQGRLAVMVRHTSAYIFSNLWLEVTTAGDSVPVVDTVNIELADMYGRWLGRGSGVSFVKVDTLPGLKTLGSEIPGKIRHIMRVDTVADLEQIGVIFVKQ